jgi:cyclohexanone monooxygenase
LRDGQVLDLGDRSALCPADATYTGVASFGGESFHSFYWPRDLDGGTAGKKVDFSGKRVAVIGTGATGVQIITEVAKMAGELFSFQRTPNWCTPLGNGPLEPKEMNSIKSRYDEILNFCRTTPTSFPFMPVNQSAQEVGPQEREAF